MKINENKLAELKDALANNFSNENKKDKINIEKLEKDFQDKINSNDSSEEYF